MLQQVLALVTIGPESGVPLSWRRVGRLLHLAYQIYYGLLWQPVFVYPIGIRWTGQGFVDIVEP